MPANFFRPFAFGATAYLWGLNLLQLITAGDFQSPDEWGDVYTALLIAYAGAPEVKRLMADDTQDDTNHWEEKIRKGGPIITLWFLLLAGAGFWRMHDAAVPMPPELKSITLKVIAVFFGTYAFRQYRKRSARRPSSPTGSTDADDSESRHIVEAYLAEKGPATPLSIAQATGLSRRSVGRWLDQLQHEGAVQRRAKGPFDRHALYALASPVKEG